MVIDSRNRARRSRRRRSRGELVRGWLASRTGHRTGPLRPRPTMVDGTDAQGPRGGDGGRRHPGPEGARPGGHPGDRRARGLHGGGARHPVRPDVAVPDPRDRASLAPGVRDRGRRPRVATWAAPCPVSETSIRRSGYRWTAEGRETLFLRSKVLIDAKAAGIRYPISGMWGGDRDDEAGLRAWCTELRDIGYYGMMLGDPVHVPLVNEMFTPSAAEVAYWKDLDRLATEAEAPAAGRSSTATRTRARATSCTSPTWDGARKNLEWARASAWADPARHGGPRGVGRSGLHGVRWRGSVRSPRGPPRAGRSGLHGVRPAWVGQAARAARCTARHTARKASSPSSASHAVGPAAMATRSGTLPHTGTPASE